MRQHMLGCGAAVALALTACGGGGGSQPRAETSSSAPTSSTPAPTVTSAAPVVQGSDTPAPNLVVGMTRHAFEPRTLTAKAGIAYDLRADNTSPLAHTFTVSEMKVNVALPRRVLTFARIPPMKAGTYRAFCTLHSDMETELRVS
jgi:plastocyanin